MIQLSTLQLRMVSDSVTSRDRVAIVLTPTTMRTYKKHRTWRHVLEFKITHAQYADVLELLKTDTTISYTDEAGDPHEVLLVSNPIQATLQRNWVLITLELHEHPN